MSFEFEAINGRQLDICLKLLYGERLVPQLVFRLTPKGKLIYGIVVTGISQSRFNDLLFKYKLQIY